MADMTPITREEKLLNSISNGVPSELSPITRREIYLSAIAGETELPSDMTPITREEQYYQKILDNGGSGEGGSSAQVVASGTFTGNGSYIADIPLGKKMAQTDFILNVWLANGTQVSPASTAIRAIVFVQIVVQKYFEAFDLSTNGDKTPSPQMAYPTVNDGGNFVNRTPRGVLTLCSFVRQTAFGSELMPIPHIIRRDTGFTFHVTKDSTEYIFMNGMTYNWEVIYVGNDPTNDIVKIA